MNNVSLTELIDVELFNKLNSIFEIPIKDFDWLVTPTEDFGRWRNLTIDNLNLMLSTDMEKKVYRSIALYFWAANIHSDGLNNFALNYLKDSTDLDVFLEAFLLNTNCDQLYEDTFTKSLKECQRETPLEYLVALEALGKERKSSITNSRLLQECVGLLLLKRYGVLDDPGVYVKMYLLSLEEPSENNLFCDCLVKISKNAPSMRSSTFRDFAAHGYSYKEIITLSYLLQCVNKGIALYKANKKMENLANIIIQEYSNSASPYTENEKRFLKHLKNQFYLREMPSNVICSENYQWFIQIYGISKNTSVSFNNGLWRSHLASMSDAEKSQVLLQSLSKLSKKAMIKVCSENSDILKMAFSFYYPKHASYFKAVFDAGLIKDYFSSDGVILYTAEYFNSFKTKDSYLFLLELKKKFFVIHPAYELLLKNVSNVDFSYLEKDEAETLFSILNDYVFYNQVTNYEDFIVNNKDYSVQASQILKNSKRGDKYE